MKPRVYVETTIASYLVARPSRDLVVAAHQKLTLEWWETQRERFEVFVSDLVLLEASKGDEVIAAKRTATLTGIPILESTDEAKVLAAAFLASRVIPAKAAADSLHVAIATAQGMEFLLTWNCRHIANAEIIDGLETVALAAGYRIPMLCTPEQLMGR